MSQTYYVDPDYWIAGYAQGDIFDASALVTAQMVASAEVLRVRSAAGSISSALTVTALAGRMQSTAASIIATATMSATIVTLQNASAQILAALSTSAFVLRIRDSSASLAFSAIVTANARFLWEPEPIPTDIWTDE